MKKITISDVRVLPGDSGFLIDDGKTAILYDSGFAFTGNALAENIKKVLGTRQLDYIFLTHSHYDHALGSVYVSRAYPGAKIVAGAYAKSIFQKPTARAVMRDLDRKAAANQGVTEYEDLIDDLRVDIAVEDGDTITCGATEFTVIALPGHTKCSVGFYLPENKLLLGSETLGVYFGEDTYLPSYLVGYQMTLDAFQKAKALDVQQILLPHYGLVEKAEAAIYLSRAEQVARENARLILDMLQSGKTPDEIGVYLEKTTYKPIVEPTYPIDAFQLNTGIMIRLIRKELLDT